MPRFLRRATLRHLLFVVLALTALSQAAVGLLLYLRLQSQLEADLARRLEHVASLLAFSIAEPAGAFGVLGNRFTYHVALRLSEARSGLPNLGDRPIVKRERHTCHNGEIMP